MDDVVSTHIELSDESGLFVARLGFTYSHQPEPMYADEQQEWLVVVEPRGWLQLWFDNRMVCEMPVELSQKMREELYDAL